MLIATLHQMSKPAAKMKRTPYSKPHRDSVATQNRYRRKPTGRTMPRPAIIAVERFKAAAYHGGAMTIT